MTLHYSDIFTVVIFFFSMDCSPFSFRSACLELIQKVRNRILCSIYFINHKSNILHKRVHLKSISQIIAEKNINILEQPKRRKYSEAVIEKKDALRREAHLSQEGNQESKALMNSIFRFCSVSHSVLFNQIQ